MKLTYRGIKYEPLAITIAANHNEAIGGKYRGQATSVSPSHGIPRLSLTTLKYRGVDYFPEINHRVDVTNSRTKFQPIIA